MTNPSLMDKMPRVRGKLMENVRLSKYTWLGGGVAEILFWPKDEQDWEFFANIPSDVPITIWCWLQHFSADGGITGVTIRLGKGFQNIEISRGKIKGTGYPTLNLLRSPKKMDFQGLSFYREYLGLWGGLSG